MFKGVKDYMNFKELIKLINILLEKKIVYYNK
jgi:hypothetical protein